MSGFSAALNQLCEGTVSLEAALSAFHREAPGDLNVLSHFRLIESAWRAGKLNRHSYEVLRSAALARSAKRISSPAQQDAVETNEAVFASRSHSASAGHDTDNAPVNVRAERHTRLQESGGTRLRTPAGESEHRSSARSLAADAAANNRPREADPVPITNPSQWSQTAPQPLGPGSVLKERFVLEQAIGRGGMGTIFRARDLRKEEAQDRNPYVAVKVLNEDFRRHPESLIALQREARKAQSIAHPNVATVFDFDRDGPVVFLVMELLEGVSLDRFIKSRVGRPLPRAEAMRIVTALGSALAHAHQRGLVHADFKPANAFRTHDGTVKVLDFGIARAIGLRVHDSQHTVFDPASLGAFTPCYASPEMLVGDSPDPRDDVYALACVSYELFCSRHPFDFLSSALAERRGLKPAPIPGLDRHIWRALLHGLAFSRDSRAPSVEVFLAEMAPVHRFRRAATFAAIVAVGALGVVSWNVLPDYLRDQAHARNTAELQSGDPAVIDALLPRLLELPAPQRRTLFDDPTTRDGLISHMERKVRAAIDPAREHVDYDEAARYVDQLARLLPDASAADRLRTDIEASRQQALAGYLAALPEQIKRGWLTDAQNSENVLRTIEKVRQIDPQWQPDLAMLNSAFMAHTRQALYDRKDPAAAAALVAAAKEIGLETAQLDAMITQQRVAEASVPQPPPAQPQASVAEERQIAARAPEPAPASTRPSPSASSPSASPSESIAATPSAPESAPAPIAERSAPKLTIEQKKNRLLALAAADDLEALELLRGLKSEIPSDDAFLRQEAPEALAAMYLRLSNRAFDNGEFESAAALLDRAAEFNPDAAAIAARRESVDRVAHVAHTLEFVISFPVNNVIAELENIEASEGHRFPLIRTHLAEILAQRIFELQSTEPQRANELLKAGRQIFPGSTVFDSLPGVESDTAARAQDTQAIPRAEVP